ncbi:MAG: helix-turn-helix domain-containing protein [Erysipelotrichaceae bacterium]|jgi:repressor LexA|nr:helix-turn-helix domain-containing protein [Erysipelotrichaceae bacterium]
MSIGKRIKEARIKKKMTQEDLGKLIGKSKSAVNNYENSVRGLNSNLLIKIIDALDVDANYLFQDYYLKDELKISDKAKKLYQSYMNTDEYTQKSVDSILSNSLERAEKMTSYKLITRPLFFEVEEFVKDNRFASVGFSLPDTPNNRESTAILIAFEDAMKPIYGNKDCILIKAADRINYDEIGIFQVGDRFVMRRLGIDVLTADNELFEPIPIDDSVRCVAKILRKIS